MTTLPPGSLAFAGLILLAVAACANSSVAPATDAAPVTGVDLGPSTRVPRAQLPVAAAGHEAHRGMSEMAATPAPRVHESGSSAHSAGTVNRVDPTRHTINLSHDPIPALGWPAMTMDFATAPSVDLSRIQPGSRVDFSIEKSSSGMYQVQSVQPAGGGH